MYNINFVSFYIDTSALHLGGPEICQGDIVCTYTFNDSSSPTINLTLCGVPQPQVQVEFIEQKVTVLNVPISSYTHRFILQLPLLTQTECGKELTITATGYNGSLVKRTKIFVENCKCDDFVHFILVFNVLLIALRGTSYP